MATLIGEGKNDTGHSSFEETIPKLKNARRVSGPLLGELLGEYLGKGHSPGAPQEGATGANLGKPSI